MTVRKTVMQNVLGWFGLGARPAPSAATATEISAIVPPGIAEVVPAVAGYARRIAKIDFMLAARLASVARLNTADGRKPYAARRPRSDAPAIPQARIGAKTQRAASHGLRVLRPALPRSSAQIIPFPVQPAASSDVAKAIAKAA